MFKTMLFHDNQYLQELFGVGSGLLIEILFSDNVKGAFEKCGEWENREYDKRFLREATRVCRITLLSEINITKQRIESTVSMLSIFRKFQIKMKKTMRIPLLSLKTNLRAPSALKELESGKESKLRVFCSALDKRSEG